MFIKTLTASIVCATLLTPAQAQADGIVSFDLGDTHVCLGLISCLFKTAPDGDRDADGAVDHRRQATDHRDDPASADGVRDHRRSGVAPDTIRDHRTEITIRDHRSAPDSETVPVTGYRKDCRLGASKLFRMGYRSIRAVNCDGTLYQYTALDGTAFYKAEMNAFSGEMKVTFVGITG